MPTAKIFSTLSSQQLQSHCLNWNCITIIIIVVVLIFQPPHWASPPFSLYTSHKHCQARQQRLYNDSSTCALTQNIAHWFSADYFKINTSQQAFCPTIMCQFNKCQSKHNSPLHLSSSGTTRSDRSGSSPCQNIHSSLAAVKESDGCTIKPLLAMSKRPPLGSFLTLATRRHTHRMSAARQREYDRSTGSSSGSLVAFGRSFTTNLRHLIPHKSVCKEKRNREGHINKRISLKREIRRNNKKHIMYS